jgi:hypothetical protein
MSTKDHRVRFCLVRIMLLNVAVTVGFFVGGCGSCVSREVPPDRSCHLNLEYIGKAIVDYRAMHGNLPQVVKSPGGHEHSWRALLIPNLLARSELQKTIDYRLDDPWNSPHNRESLRNSTLSCRCTCPLESDIVGHPFISYVMLVRPVSKDPHTGRPVQAALPDDAVLIVESANCHIEYAEPKDIDWNALWEGESPFGPGKLNSLHPRIVKAVRVDGKVIDIPKNLGEDELRKLLSGNTDRS